MKIKNLNKKEILLITGIGLLIMSLPYILTRSFSGISFSDTGIGDTIGGITAPFLSFFGSILVYMALKTQIDANEKFKEQFQKQNQDQLFFKMVDSLNNRIRNSPLREVYNFAVYIIIKQEPQCKSCGFLCVGFFGFGIPNGKVKKYPFASVYQ